MDNKQTKETAVKWLIDQLPRTLKVIIADKLQDALEREEEQIVDAWQAGYERDFAASPEDYYVSNYGYLR
jgi:hypothetical protein